MEEIFLILYQICLGLLISGAILTIIAFFLAGLSFGTEGDLIEDIPDAEIDLSVDVDMDIDTDVEINYDADVDDDIESEVEIDSVLESDIDTDAFSAMSVTPAPRMLLFSCFLLFSGILGVSFYDFFFNKFVWVILTFSIPYVLTKIVSRLWRKIAVSKFYQISSRKNLIGKRAIVSIVVNEKGGIIKIPTNTPLGFEKFPAKPMYSLTRFNAGDQVYICDKKENYFLIDKNKESINWRLLKRKNVVSRH